MPGRSLVLTLLGFLVCQTGGFAAWPHEQSDLAPDPSIHFGTLPNGLRYAIKPNAEPRGRTVLRLLVLAGSLHEQEDQRGLAHFVEHMAFNGTRLYPHETLQAALQRHGFAFGADVSAFTFLTHTIYGLEAPSANPERLDEAFAVLREFADGQTFDPDEIERERGVIASERRTRDNWQSRAGDEIGRFLFPRSLLSQRNPIGDPAILQRAGAAELRRFYTTWYRPDNLILIVAGDAPPEEIEALIEKKFGSMAAATVPLPAPPKLGRLGNPSKPRAMLYSTAETGAVTVQVTSIVAGPGEVETLASRQASFRGELVMNMLGERLDQLRRANSHEFGDSAAQTSAFGLIYSQHTLSLTSASINWRKAVRSLAVELRRVEEQGFTTAEIAEAIQRIRRRYEYAIASAETEASATVADRIAFGFVQRCVPSSWTQVQAQAEAILATFDRTAAMTAFRRLWSPGDPTWICTGNLILPKPEKNILTEYRESRGDVLPPPPTPVISRLAYAAATTPGAIYERHYIADLDIHTVEFANGVRLNLKATKFNRNLVQFYARVGRGLLSLPPRQAGLNLLASKYLIEAGVAQHDGEELRRYMAQLNLGISFGIGEDACIFTGGSDTRGLPDLFSLLQAYLTDPAWHQDDFVTAQIQTLQLYSDATLEADAALNATAARVMSRDNPFFALPPADTVGQRNLGELAGWLELNLKKGPVEIGLVGDFDVETAIIAAQNTLGAIATRAVRMKPPDATPAVRFFGTPGRWQNFVSSTIPRAAVRVQWLVNGCSDVHTLRQLETLSSILENRVLREIRETLGATYDPSGLVWNGDTLRDDGYLMLRLTAPPAEALNVARRIQELADDLALNGMTEDELEAVRQPILSGNDTRLRQNNYWLFYVLQALQEEPQRLEWPRSREADYRAMTTEGLHQLAKEYLSAANAQTFVAIPRDPAAKSAAQPRRSKPAPNYPDPTRDQRPPSRQTDFTLPRPSR